MGGMHVVVIGAGVAGVSAAYELAGRGVDVTVLEGADRVGGKLRVSRVGGLAVDEGAEMFLVRVPEAVDLVTRLGLADRVVHPVTTSAGVYVGGAARPLPAGTVMGVPADPESVRGVLGAAGVAAARAELAAPGEPLTGDVAVGELVAARLGRSFVDNLVDPLLGGVYAGRADLLSLGATVPGLYAALQQVPSLVRAAAAATGQPPPSVTGGPAADASRPLGSPPGNPVFGTLPDGLGTLPEAVLAASGAKLHLGLPARELHRTPTGFRVVAGPVPAPTVLAADAVVVAIPANKAAPLLRGVAPAAATDLAAIEYASMAVVTLVFEGVPLPAGSGLLVPATAGRAVKALTYSSTKWAHLSRARVVRASLGRFGEAAVLRRDDPDLVDLVRTDLAALTGVHAEPVDTRVTRWGGGLPQYAVGHLDRVRRVRAAVAAVPGLAVCGAAYEGVGVPACIRGARAAVAQVLDGYQVAAQSQV
jgi:protoporphyrinogen/coproporphyrinogen III oxidase